MGDEERRVCVYGKSTVVPGRAVTSGKTHPLSNLDHMMQLHNVRLVYYYRDLGVGGNGNGNEVKGSDLIGSLRDSLSAALSSYPAVCGRLQTGSDGNWEVKCCDAGVRVLEAKANVSLDKWLEAADRSSELQLTYWENSFSDPHVSALFCVQLTEFEGAGLAIGLSCGHMVADPSCATLLMKAWGEAHRRAQIMHPPFFHPPGLKARPQMNRTTAATQYYDSVFRNNTEVPGGGVYETVIFKFGHEAVQQCISEVESGAHKCGGSVSAFEAVCALFWVCCTRAQGKPATEHSRLSICSEFRKIIVAPLPRGFFGNALHFSEVSMGAGELKSCDDLSHPARMIHENLFALEREEFRSVIEWLEARKNKEGKLPPPFYLYGPHLTCANWEEFFTYEAVFSEKQKPLHVSYYVEPMHGEGLILVLPSAEGNSSRTVMVTLPGNQSFKLCSDPDILRFSPTIWMKSRSA